jgi:hypothetical protein
VTTLATVDHDILSALGDLAKAVGAPSQPAARRERSKGVPPAGVLTDDAVGQSIGLLLPENAILVSDSPTRTPRERRFADSLLEGHGFEIPVPRERGGGLSLHPLIGPLLGSASLDHPRYAGADFGRRIVDGSVAEIYRLKPRKRRGGENGTRGLSDPRQRSPHDGAR